MPTTGDFCAPSKDAGLLGQAVGVKMNQASSATRADMAGDRPLTAPGQDRLGFSELAAHLAVALIDRATGDGMVVGLEGAWG